MKVLVVDGAREAENIVAALRGLDNIAIAATVPDLATASRSLAQAVPDIVVTSSALPDGDSAALIDLARRFEPMPAIVVLDDAPSRDEWLRHLGAGADRVVARDDDLSELRDVIAALVADAEPDIDIGDADPFRLVGRLGAGVAHDLNNYLNVVRTGLDMHATKGYGLREAREALDAAIRLTGTLVGYVRGRELPRETLDLGEIVTGIVALAGSAIAPNVQLVVDVKHQVRPIYGIRTELEQLVLNLIVNASDAMRADGGTITVAVKPTVCAAVLLEVTDEGRGLDRHAFESIPTNGRVAGLGLAIVRDVADRHSAVVRVADAERGTIVRVAFPVLTTPNPPS